MSLKTTTAPCPKCGPGRNFEVLSEQVRRVERNDPSDPDWSQTVYRIIKCGGCNEHMFQTVDTNSEEDVEVDDGRGGTEVFERETHRYWPPFRSDQRPKWTRTKWCEDNDLIQLLNDTYSAFDNELYVLAAIGMRTVLDRATEVLRIHPGASFGEKLQALSKEGLIATVEKQHLQALVDAGSAAAHRGWRPTSDQLESMLLILESFLHKVFVLPHRAKRLTNIPPRPPRKA